MAFPIITNALTVDVEDYFQVSAFDDYVRRSEWSTMPLRVERNTRALLDLFDHAGAKCTFFVLGWIAERCPQLVREIDNRGHEVASHGYSHTLVYKQSRETFYEETRRSKDVLEDTIGKSVDGYRAASYSITPESLWALDVLAEVGFTYDSSVFPIHHDRYGIPDAERQPHLMSLSGGKRLAEFPISTWRLLGQNIPIAGGGYFRIFPYTLTSYGLGQINSREKMPFVFYLHPWEIDSEQPRIQCGRLSRFRHYTNLHRTELRLRRLLGKFRFATMREILTERNLIEAEGIPA